MALDISSVDLLLRREIEALIAAPLIRAYADEIGAAKSEEIAAKVIQTLARESGENLAALAGGNSIDHLAQGFSLFSQNGALVFDIVEKRTHRLTMHVKRCKYAEMYRHHSLETYGYLLSCRRDYALVEGFNPDIRFTRTQTIMQDAEYCDFCFELKNAE